MKKTGKKERVKPARKKAGKPSKRSCLNDAFEQSVQLVYEKALSNYEQAKEAGLKFKRPNLAAIRAALKLHTTPWVDIDKMVLEADRAFRTAVDSLKAAGDGQAMEHILNAVTGWVELLRELFVEPPETCRETALKIVRERLTFPINFAGIPKKFRKNETNQTEAFDWLYRHGFQQDCCPGLPRTRGGAGIDELRSFAYSLFVELERLRAELDLRPPSGALEAEVAALSGKLAGAEWKQFFLDAPEKLFGKRWILESPQMEDYRQAVKGRQHSTHQAKGKKVRDKEMNMARDAISRFKSIANSIFRTK